MTDDYNEEWPKTGTPAHNESQPRGIHIADDAPLTDKYPPYAPDPACMECGGEGWTYHQITRYDRDGEAVDIDVEKEPCDCIFNYMTVEADPHCKACEGTGEVEEVRLVKTGAVEERVATHYSCLCLRYIPSSRPNEGEGDGE